MKFLSSVQFSKARPPRPAARLGLAALACAAVLVFRSGVLAADTNPSSKPEAVTAGTNAAALPVADRADQSQALPRPGGAEAPTNSGSRVSRTPDFTAFRTVAERNIFNANRSGRREISNNAGRRRVARIETFTLVGTLSYEKGDFAFFDGSGADFRKVLELDGTIAGFTVVEVLPHGVVLASKEKQFELALGGQMRRTDGGEWTQAAVAEAEPVAPSSSSAENGASDAPSGPVSDVLKRLMEQREKEMR